MFTKCMISWVVLLEGRMMGVVDDDTYQWLLEFCVEFSQTAVVVVNDSVKS